LRRGGGERKEPFLVLFLSLPPPFFLPSRDLLPSTTAETYKNKRQKFERGYIKKRR
jgi:hypothetical protein